MKLEKRFERLINATDVYKAFRVNLPVHAPEPPAIADDACHFWDPGWDLTVMFFCMKDLRRNILWTRGKNYPEERCFASCLPQYRTFQNVRPGNLALPARQVLMWMVIRLAVQFRFGVQMSTLLSEEESFICKPSELRDGSRVVVRMQGEDIALLQL